MADGVFTMKNTFSLKSLTQKYELTLETEMELYSYLQHEWENDRIRLSMKDKYSYVSAEITKWFISLIHYLH